MGSHHQETKTEPLNPQDFSSEPFTVGKHLSMLRLDNSKPSPSASTSALKRPSSPPSQQPNPKKEKLSPLFPGFSKITPLPPLPKTQSVLLRLPNPAPAHLQAPATTIPPNTKRRLRRIKDRFREMTLWFEQVMLEDDEQVGEEQVPENQQQEVEEQILNIEPSDEHVQHLDNTAVTKEDCDQKRFEESVSVEKVGDCIVIHFSCHCGVPYQFLLAGGNCYYKLM
ncbi:hypothetical protein M0R45_022500 [Rubus argutus]|uniref:Uncharacterized protein n=1 Tax=Rubus argutus TaxID=59490 RepID=A0AAW1XFH3_RUBAR